MNDALRLALSQLDPDLDEHWTDDGLPAVAVVANLSRQPMLTRELITASAPEFTRELARDERHNADGPIEPEVPGDAPPAEEAPEAPSDDPEPATDTDAPATQDEDESVLTMSAAEVFQNPVLCERALRIYERKCHALSAEKTRVETELADVYNHIDILSRQLDRLQRTNPNRVTDDIRAVLEQGQKERERKAKAAQAFIAAGTTPGDVLAHLDPRAKIDRVMSRRGPGIGDRRQVRTAAV